MDTKQQLRLLWSSRWWLIGFALVAALAAYLVSASREDTYEATASAQVIPAQQADGSSVTTDQLLQSTNFYAELAQTTRIVDAARREGSFGPSYDEAVDVTAQPDLLVLEFEGRAGEPDLAAAYANGYAEAFASEVERLAESQRRRLFAGPQSQIDEIREELAAVPVGSPEAATLQAQLQALQTRIAEVAVSPTDAVRVIQPALPPREAASPKPLRDALLAFLVALVLASTALILRHAFTDRYASLEEAALDLRLPVLGELPKADPADRKAMEALRKLRAQVEFSLSTEPLEAIAPARRPSAGAEKNVLLVTSPEAGAGKTYVTAGLSRALAADGRRITAVDADLRRPMLHRALDAPQAPGLGELLDAGHIEDRDLSTHVIPQSEPVRRRGGVLEIMPAGRLGEDTAERLSSATMARVVGEVADESDLVVLDSPPVLAIVDAVVLTRYANGVILVLDARRTRRRNVRRAVETLRAVQAPILGLVFNRSEVSASEYGYYGAAPARLRREAELTG